LKTSGIENAQLLAEWHPTKNKYIKPSQVCPGSHKKVWWICVKGHEWEAAIQSRTNGRGCPYCAGKKVDPGNNFGTNFPHLADQWHPMRNGNLLPLDFNSGSHKRVWWQCSKGHEWSATIKDRARGRRCPYCLGKRASSGHNLAENIGLVQEWDHRKNEGLDPSAMTPFSRKKIWWKCAKGHEWQASVASRSSGSGCPYCSHHKLQPGQSLADLRPDLAKEWHSTNNGQLKASEVALNSNRKVWWKCDNGHEWQAIIQSRTDGTGCLQCWKNRQAFLVSGLPLKRSDLLRKPKFENSLASLNTEVSTDWHPTIVLRDKNGS
jgi:hypothetical protein